MSANDTNPATPTMKSLLALAVLPLLAGVATADDEPGAGEKGGKGLAILVRKALTVPADPKAPQVVDNAVIQVKDGDIELVAPRRGYEVPDGYEVLDAGDAWAMPGAVELHCHVGGTFDINDMVYLANPGCSTRTAVIPNNPMLKMGLAGGVTTVLYIPGSGTNIGGTGVLFKTGHDKYEDAKVRDPGSIKLAQWGNPESWAMGVTMSFENWNTRNTFRRGLAYAKRWEAHEKDVEEYERKKKEAAEQGTAPPAEPEGPEYDPMWEPFRKLYNKETVVSTHTQVYQVVLMTLTMIKGEFGVDVFLDHSTIGGWLAGEIAAEMNVPAICGPRSVDPISRGFMNWAHTGYEGVRGVAAGYQERGVPLVGFNTDSPVITQEELPLQAAMGCRYGFKDDAVQALRGLTIVPAITAGVDHKLGSLERGKDADIVIATGTLQDPRTTVRFVFVDGKLCYEPQEDARRW